MSARPLARATSEKTAHREAGPALTSLQPLLRFASGAVYLENAALASLNSHAPPPFESSETILCKDRKLSSKLSRQPLLSGPHLFSFLLLLVVVLLQFFTWPEHVPIPFPPREDGSASQLEVAFEHGHCLSDSIFAVDLPVCRPHKMALLEEAKTVAAEFDFSADDVRRNVKAFVDQMREQCRSAPIRKLTAHRRRLARSGQDHEPNSYLCDRGSHGQGEGMAVHHECDTR